MVMSYIKGAVRYIFTHTLAWGLVYESYTPWVYDISSLLLHIVNPSSSIVIEECNFLSLQLQVQYWLALLRLKFEFLDHVRQYSLITWPIQWIYLRSSIVIEEHKLSFCTTMSSVSLSKIWFHRSCVHTWTRSLMIIFLKQLGKEA